MANATSSGESVAQKWLTTRDLAEALGVTVRAIQLRLAEGKLRADMRTLGGHARFRRTRLDEILRRREESTEAA